MKAYLIETAGGGFASVEFAENVAKAKYQAIQREHFQDWVDDHLLIRSPQFFEVSARRVPELDKYYKKGKTCLEWDLPADRKALVRFGFCCDEINENECKSCPAADVCDFYQDYLKSLQED